MLIINNVPDVRAQAAITPPTTEDSSPMNSTECSLRRRTTGRGVWRSTTGSWPVRSTGDWHPWLLVTGGTLTRQDISGCQRSTNISDSSVSPVLETLFLCNNSCQMQGSKPITKEFSGRYFITFFKISLRL